MRILYFLTCCQTLTKSNVRVMNTLSRKQREIREREGLILDVARRLLVQRGYFGLNMDRIAAETEYSKGTIYQHFRSKEDVLAGLVAQAMEMRVALFERAALFRGTSRERMVAIGEAATLFVQRNPQHFQCEQIICAAGSEQRKTDPSRHEVVDALERTCFDVVIGVLRDGIVRGDLDAAPSELPGITFGLWSAHIGAHQLAASGKPLEDKGIGDPVESIRRNAHALLDGYGWRPLFADHDYEDTVRRIHAEVFADEERGR